MSDLGHPVQIKYIPELAFTVTEKRPEKDRTLKPPGKNWAKAFELRHPKTKARRLRALHWNRHEKNLQEDYALVRDDQEGLTGSNCPIGDCV